MNTLTQITGHTRTDPEKSQDVSEKCATQCIEEWAKQDKTVQLKWLVQRKCTANEDRLCEETRSVWNTGWYKSVCSGNTLKGI